MSNALAIAAVTATLQNLLVRGFATAQDFPGTEITVRPPDKARNTNANTNQINLFLYHTTLDAAWRNMDVPGRTKPGETGPPPLPLNLFYLLTAYARDNDDLFSHLLLGHAMRIFHDNPVLGADEIRQSLDANHLHEQVDLQEQVDRIHFIPQSLTLDEMSRLWTSFQTQYRISATYQASVVLIESRRSARTPLPVVARNRDDTGASAQPDLTPPFPTITTVGLPPAEGKRTSVLPGDLLVLSGHHLVGDDVTVRFTSHRLATPIPVPVGRNRMDDAIQVTLPDAPADWVADAYTVAAEIVNNNTIRETNALSFALAPTITSALPMNIVRDANGDAAFNLTCKPEVRPGQRVTLLIGDRETAADAHESQTGALAFTIRAASAGTFFVRLRVDGIDSQLVDYTRTPPLFKATNTVTIT